MNGALVILRPLIAYTGRQFPAAARTAIILRWLFLYAIGHPTTTAFAILAPQFTNPSTIGYLQAVTAVHAAELITANLVWPLGFWRDVWSTKRRWATQYAIIDNTTAAVQASLGGGSSSFFTSSRTLTRPILGHPALSILPRLNWRNQTADWGISTSGSGTTLPQIAETTDAISGAYPYVHQTRIDYQHPGSSIGVIRFWYAPERDPLAAPTNAETWNP